MFPEHNWEQKSDDIVKYQANVFALGDDWQGKFDHLSGLCEVVYLPRTEDISTTDIKTALSKIKVSELDEIERQLHSVIEVVKGISQNY